MSLYESRNTAFPRCLIECRDEYKYNVEAVELLIRNHLVNMQQYDLHLAQVWKELSGKRDSGSWEVCLLSVLSFLHCAFCVASQWRMV